MHIGRLHDKSIPTFKGGTGRKRRLHVHNGNGNGSLQLAVLPRSNRGTKPHAHNHVHTTRKYTRKVAVATAHAAPGTEVKVNFCNNCGSSIEGQAQGIVIANLLKSNPRFRAKVEKLLAKE